MKKTLHFLFVLCLGLVSAQATIIQVNNNPDADADYSNLQQAIDNANAGDTLYIAGSASFYDGTASTIRLNKELTLLGPGYLFVENGNSQQNNQTVKLYRLIIGEGADNSLISGIQIEGNFGHAHISLQSTKRNGSNGTAGPANVMIERSLLNRVLVYSSSQTVIQHNYFLDDNDENIRVDKLALGVIIQNNIMAAPSPNIYGNPFAFETQPNLVIRNNVLHGSIQEINGAEIYSNIFLDNKGLVESDNNQVKNNIFTSAVDIVVDIKSDGNSLADNVFSITQSDLFIIDVPMVDKDYVLDDSSPAIGVGLGSIDAGVFGGASPYRISGLPSIPRITELTTTGVGTTESGIKVTVKARSNQ